MQLNYVGSNSSVVYSPEQRRCARWGCILILSSLLILLAAMADASSSSEVAYAKGILSFGKGNYERALDYFLAAAAVEPDNPHIRLHIGLCLSNLGQFEEAVSELQKALQIQPDWTYVYYHLGLAFYRLQRYQQAEEAFQAFLAANPDGPEARAARHNLNVISLRQSERRILQLQGSVSVQYDDNVVLEPNDDILDISDKDDGRTVFTFTGRLLPVRTASWYLGGDYAFFQSLQFDLTEYDIQKHVGRVFTGYKLNRTTLRLAADYTYTTLDRKEFSKAVTILPSISIRQTDKLSAVVSGFYRDNNFSNQVIASGQKDVRDRDGWNTLVGFDQYLAFNQKQSLARLSYYFGASRNEGSDWEYNSHQVGLGLQFPLVWGFELNLDGLYRRRNYLNENSYSAEPLGILTSADQTKRRDNRYVGSVRLQRSLGSPLIFSDTFISADFTHIRNDSNIDFFDYDRNIVALTLTVRY